ncbi:MAG: glutathione S-transferase family protein, partial [Alphaproteobacteria bacterium]|nr:glutathione S-transferase family protein [Alphaproteobacteria bacterium]
MTLRLHYHPLSSYCWKVLIALHENDTPFEPVLVDLSKEEDRNAFYALWPIGKFPVVEDTARNNWFVPESSIIIEYPNQHYPGRTKLIPADPDAARQTRMRDRFFDLHVHNHMQKIIADRLRPQGANDTIGVSMARSQMDTALGMVERQIGDHWTMGESFTMADCAAA